MSNIGLLKQKKEEQEGSRKENKAREFVRLGTKIIITLREEKKGGIHVVSEEKRRAKSKTIRKKII